MLHEMFVYFSPDLDRYRAPKMKLLSHLAFIESVGQTFFSKIM